MVEIAHQLQYDQLPVAILILAPQAGTILDCSAQAERLLGRSRAEIVGLHTGDLGTIGEAESRSPIAEGAPTNYEAELQTKTGEVVPVLVNATLAKFQGHKLLLQVLTELGEQKQTARVLEESERKYRTMVENTNDVPYCANAEGLLTYLGPQASHYGIDPASTTSKHIEDLLVPHDREKVLRDFHQSIATGDEFPTEFRIRDVKGEERWFEEVAPKTFAERFALRMEKEADA